MPRTTPSKTTTPETTTPQTDVVTDPPTPRTRVRRLAERARYDAPTVHAILDEGFICHVGLCTDSGPVVLPTAYARVGSTLLLHGAPANAVLSAGSSGAELCVTVTLVDGLVLARSAFHHSINYRSVVVFGIATEVRDRTEKERALEAIVEHLVPGRGVDARPPDDRELKKTQVLSLPLHESSAKVRTGGPNDDADDLALPIWAGQIPLRLERGDPVTDERVPSSLPVPGYAF